MFLALNLPTAQQDQDALIKALTSTDKLTLCHSTAPFVPVEEGAYRNADGVLVRERAYCINADDFTEQVKDLLATCGQEAVLLRDGEFQCWLLKKDDGEEGSGGYSRVMSPEGVKEQWAGHWREVPVTQVGDRAYTKIHGRYFVTVKGN